MSKAENAGRFDIYLIGVGGQGIGLLSEALIQAADLAGLPVRGVDTHGLAQRGGTVVSFLRVGGNSNSPMIAAGSAHLVLALERHEALRGASEYLRQGGTLLYYDAVWQPLSVRLGREANATAQSIEEVCSKLQAKQIRVFVEDLPDARMQNVAMIATMARERLVPSIEARHYREALQQLLPGIARESNLALFDRLS